MSQPAKRPLVETKAAFSALLRELEDCSPELFDALIEGLMVARKCSRDAAIRDLAQFESMTRRFIEALNRSGEA